MDRSKFFTAAKVACDYQPACAGFFENKNQELPWGEGFIMCFGPLEREPSTGGSILYIQPGKSYL